MVNAWNRWTAESASDGSTRRVVPLPKTFEESLAAIQSYIGHYPKRNGPTYDALVLRVDSAAPAPYSSHDFRTGFEPDADKVAIKGFSLKCFILSDAMTAWFPLKFIASPDSWDLLPTFDGSIYYNQGLVSLPKQFDIVEVQYDLAGGYKDKFDPRLDSWKGLQKRVNEGTMDDDAMGAMSVAFHGKFIKNTGRNLLHLVTGLNFGAGRTIEDFVQKRGDVQTIEDLQRTAADQAKKELIELCAEEYDKLDPTELWPGTSTSDQTIRTGNHDVITNLHPEMKLMCKCFIYRCYLDSIFIRLNSGYRSPAKQAGIRKEYITYTGAYPKAAASWSKTNQYATVADGAVARDEQTPAGHPAGAGLDGRGFLISSPSGGSWHNVGLAFDFNPYLPPDGNALGKGSSKSRWVASGIVEMGREIGLRWGGDFNDKIHFDAKELALGSAPYQLLQAAADAQPPIAANQVPLGLPATA